MLATQGNVLMWQCANVTLALLANVLMEDVSKVDLCGLNHRARRMQSSLLELLSRSR